MNGMVDDVRACSTVFSSIRLAHETSRSEYFSMVLSLSVAFLRRSEGPRALVARADKKTPRASSGTG
ncbi:hypothetical protein GCM10009717_01500 [Agromyces allii]|uniref:Uncharacterized protein n=1 Tax=Agromyces allii TaxID=393607 RepID=A0ABN2Q1Q8_9MICO